MKTVVPVLLLMFSILVEILVTTAVAEAVTANPVRELQIPFRFPGIDWDVHPRHIYVAGRGGEYDCTGEFFDCIRATSPLTKICAFNHLTWYFEDYYNQCEVTLENCQYRQKHKGGISHPKHNAVYYNGQKFGCWYYYRRSGNLDEFEKLYFKMGGTTKTAVLTKNDILPTRPQLPPVKASILSKNEVHANRKEKGILHSFDASESRANARPMDFPQRSRTIIGSEHKIDLSIEV